MPGPYKPLDFTKNDSKTPYLALVKHPKVLKRYNDAAYRSGPILCGPIKYFYGSGQVLQIFCLPPKVRMMREFRKVEPGKINKTQRVTGALTDEAGLQGINWSWAFDWGIFYRY